ncbi:MAG: carboxymuconolactone decarboxylase family protein, partial [Porticoccaceae bacterium]|nr:carboxymuconolactone decarboxylase family protein [Porticoccaceae bacterium]
MSNKLTQVKPLATQHWDKALTKVIEDTKGAPLHVHQLMANNPKLLDAWWDFRNHSVEGGTLGKRAGELVILRVAVHMQAWYEWGSHVDRALTCGLSIDEINRVLSHSTE